VYLSVKGSLNDTLYSADYIRAKQKSLCQRAGYEYHYSAISDNGNFINCTMVLN
jgi:hypothetical protein